MKVTVQKDEFGKVSICFDGEEREYEVSRTICGYEGENGQDSIFSDFTEISLNFGEYGKTFSVNMFDWSDPKSIEKEIRSRIKPIKDWIKECKAQAYTHTFTIK